jgi:hypothetical protein
MGLRLLASLPQLAEISAPPLHWPETGPQSGPESGPEEGVDISEGNTDKGNTDEGMVNEISMVDLTAPLPYSLEDTPLASVGDPGHVPTLTESIDRALADPTPVPTLASLAVQLTGSVGSGLSLASIDRMVSSFRASRHWREEAATTSFMTAMLEAFGPTCMPDAHLEHLLRLWDWRYGEASLAQGDRRWGIGASLSHSIAKTVPPLRIRGGMPDSQIRLLVWTLCKEPAPSGSGRPTYFVLAAHASWVGNALVQAFEKITFERKGLKKYVEWREQQLKRILQHTLDVPSVEPLWKSEVLQMFHDEGVGNPKVMGMPNERWTAVFVEALESFLSPPGSNLHRYPSLAAALIGLHDQVVKINQDRTTDL